MLYRPRPTSVVVFLISFARIYTTFHLSPQCLYQGYYVDAVWKSRVISRHVRYVMLSSQPHSAQAGDATEERGQANIKNVTEIIEPGI